MDEFTWVQHRETGGHFHCPDVVLDEYRELGWEPSEAPDEINPCVAERIAWLRTQTAVVEAGSTKTTKPRRGETQE